jgi:hypothetical protein
MEQLSRYNDWVTGWTAQGFIPGMCGSFLHLPDALDTAHLCRIGTRVLSQGVK